MAYYIYLVENQIKKVWKPYKREGAIMRYAYFDTAQREARNYEKWLNSKGRSGFKIVISKKRI